MKNKENFNERLVLFALKSISFGVSKYSNEPIPCNKLLCKNCICQKDNVCHKGKLIEWGEKECKIPKLFTQDEINFIKYCDKIKYLARNENGRLFIYYTKPEKIIGGWSAMSNGENIQTITSLKFSSIKYEDKEPISREEILDAGVKNEENKD